MPAAREELARARAAYLKAIMIGLSGLGLDLCKARFERAVGRYRIQHALDAYRRQGLVWS